MTNSSATETYDFFDGRGPVPVKRHPNGGGIVDLNSCVDPTAFVGKGASVGECGAREFVYDVFKCSYDRDPGGEDQDGKYVKGPIRLPPNGLVTITEYHPIRFYAYPNMRADVEAAVAELARVVVDYGIPKEVAA